VYIDNIIFFAENDVTKTTLTNFLNNTFRIKNIGDVTFFFV